MIKQGEKYLVSTNDWFVTPTGFQCKSAWGVCKIINTEQAFGFTPSRPSTNWFLQIGEGDKSIIIAGCHIHYAIQCTERPNFESQTYIEKDTNVVCPVNKIYFTE